MVEKPLWIYNLRCTIYDLRNSRLAAKRTISASGWRCVSGGIFSLGFQPVETGGGRVVPLRKAGNITVRTIPGRWVERWRALRRAAGWGRAHAWQPDACRHTFATYHAAHFRNFPALQLEMGHRDSSLLRTRYVYAACGADGNAESFFNCAGC